MLFGTSIQTCTHQLRLAKKYAINEKFTILIRICSNFQKLIFPVEQNWTKKHIFIDGILSARSTSASQFRYLFVVEPFCEFGLQLSVCVSTCQFVSLVNHVMSISESSHSVNHVAQRIKSLRESCHLENQDTTFK